MALHLIHPSATSTVAASLSLTPIFCVTTKLSLELIDLVSLHYYLIQLEVSLSTYHYFQLLRCSTTVFPATLILIVAPGVPVPDRVLSVDLIPPFRNIPPSEGNVLVTSG